MKDYPSNAVGGPPPEENKPTEAPSGGYVVRKRGLLGKIKDEFIQEDAGSILDYVYHDVLKPALTKTMFDSIVNIADRALNGGRGGSFTSNLRSSLYSGVSRMSYGSYYGYGDRRDNRVQESQPSYKSTGKIDYRDIGFRNREIADDIIMQCDEMLSNGYMMSVADYLAIVEDVLHDHREIPADEHIPTSWADSSYGWDDIHSARVTIDNGVYFIKLPKPSPIKQ